MPQSKQDVQVLTTKGKKRRNFLVIKYTDLLPVETLYLLN